MAESNSEELVQGRFNLDSPVIISEQPLSKTDLKVEEADESDYDLRRRLQAEAMSKAREEKLKAKQRGPYITPSFRNTDAYFKDQQVAATGSKKSSRGFARYQKTFGNS